MMKAIHIIILFLFSLQIGAQNIDSLNYTDAKGMKQGHWIAKYDNGKVKYDGFFKDNQPNGIMKRYYDDGGLKAEFNYLDKGKKAYAKLYYPSGTLAAEGIYIDNKKDSLWRYFSYYGKHKVAEDIYQRGVINGVCRSFYSNGAVSEELEWENGMRSGNWKQFFDDGKIMLECAFLNDKRTGPFFYYFPDGKLESTGFFKNDKMHGKWVYYDPTGKVILSIEYIDGQPKDPSLLEEREKDFFNKIEQNRGKMAEPTEQDVMPGMR